MIIALYNNMPPDKDAAKFCKLSKYHIESNGHELVLPVCIVIDRCRLFSYVKGIFTYDNNNM